MPCLHLSSWLVERGKLLSHISCSMLCRKVVLERVLIVNAVLGVITTTLKSTEANDSMPISECSYFELDLIVVGHY